MPLTLGWAQVALRLLLASVAALLIGLNRDEEGHPAGVRTTMLVCLAAALAMLQVNLLLAMSGKTPSSFVMLDPMRLPLGILSGIGFIGAGVIVKRDRRLITGVTTAATLWFVTILGLLFGGGQLLLGSAAAALAVVILWGFKRVEARLPREHHGNVRLTLGPDAPTEDELRGLLFDAGFKASRWSVTYVSGGALSSIQCELKWRERASRIPQTPPGIQKMRDLHGVLSLTWEE